MSAAHDTSLVNGWSVRIEPAVNDVPGCGFAAFAYFGETRALHAYGPTPDAVLATITAAIEGV
jgi:hypothetical protein